MLPKKTKYAIKALTLLARNFQENHPVRINEIAEKERIPHKFLEAILLEMRKQGILGSKMGANGGYYLLQKPEEIFLSTIIRLTGGPIALVPCVSLNFYEPCAECKTPDLCALREVMEEVRDASVSILSKTSIADLVARENKLA